MALSTRLIQCSLVINLGWHVLQIQLSIPGRLPPVDLRAVENACFVIEPTGAIRYDDDLDNILSVLHDITQVMDHTRMVEFNVRGFGERWPAFVWPDLATLLEQISRAMRATRAGGAGDFSLDFFSQHLQRRVDAAVDGSELRLTCAAWYPDVRQERMPATEFRTMLMTLVDTFHGAATDACRPLTEQRMYREWLSASRGGTPRACGPTGSAAGHSGGAGVEGAKRPAG